MYWRNRLNKVFLKRDTSQVLNPEVSDIDDKVSCVLKPPDDFDFVIQDDACELPPVIIIQGQVHPMFYENPDVYVDARGYLLQLYSRQCSLKLPRCIMKMTIVYDHIIVEEGKDNTWVKNCHIPKILLEKNYDVLGKGTIITGEKRLPQQKAGEQSLWSYGATYSMDKSTCQVGQRNFSVDFINGNPFIKLFDAEETEAFGSYFMHGKFSFFVSGKNNVIKKYASFFMKDTVPGFIHIHCKEVPHDA
jgi:hypothetical protein